MMRNATIFDTRGQSKKLEVEYASRTTSRITSVQYALIQHFGASLSPYISYALSKDIEFVKSPAAQSMMDVYCQSDAKSWEGFVQHSKLINFRHSNPQTFNVFSNFAIGYSKHIFAPLCQYNPHGELLKGSANKLVGAIYCIYNYLKQNKVPPNCCLQLELRSIHDKSPRRIGVDNESEEDQKDDVKHQINSRIAKNHNDSNKKKFVSPILSKHKSFKINSRQTIGNTLSECVWSLDNKELYKKDKYKRYEMLCIGSEITPFEAATANTVPSCAYNNGHFCMIYNSTSTASEMMTEFCNDKNAMITTSFHAYCDQIDVYFYINDINGKLFGQRIFKHDLFITLPSLFEVKTIDNYKEMREELETFASFIPDTIYQQYYASIFGQNIINEPYADKESLSSLGILSDYNEPKEEEEIIKNLSKMGYHADNQTTERMVEMISRAYKCAKNQMKMIHPSASSQQILTFLLNEQEPVSDDDDDTNDEYGNKLEALYASPKPSEPFFAATTYVLDDNNNDVFKRPHKQDGYDHGAYNQGECRFAHIVIDLEEDVYYKYDVISMIAPCGLIERKHRGFLLQKAMDLYPAIDNSMQLIYTSMMGTLFLDTVVTMNNGQKVRKRIINIADLATFLSACFNLPQQMRNMIKLQITQCHGVTMQTDWEYIKCVAARYGKRVSDSFKALVIEAIIAHKSENKRLLPPAFGNFNQAPMSYIITKDEIDSLLDMIGVTAARLAEHVETEKRATGYRLVYDQRAEQIDRIQAYFEELNEPKWRPLVYLTIKWIFMNLNDNNCDCEDILDNDELTDALKANGASESDVGEFSEELSGVDFIDFEDTMMPHLNEENI